MINLEDYNKPAAGDNQATQRTQNWKTDSIREKLLLIQNLILSPLTQMGYGPSTGLWKKCLIVSQPLTNSVSAQLEMADSNLEPLGGLNPNIPFLFSQIREEMYTQAPHEGAWIHCEFTVHSKDGEESVLVFEYDDPQKVPGLIADREKLNVEFQQFPRSESFTPLWWQTMLAKPIGYISLPGEEEEETEVMPEEAVDTTPAEPVIQRSQSWQINEIRDKLLLLQNYILAPLTQGGHGPASGTWKKCTIYGYPLTQRGVVVLDMADGKQEYLGLHPNTSMGLGMMFHQIREEMYKQAPYEGAWLTCEYIIRSEDVDSPSVILEYDQEDAFTGGISDKKKVCREFQQFPRGEYFTPAWWQEILDGTTEYLPVPDGILPDPNAGVLDCIEKLRQNLQQNPEGLLHLSERMRLYQQIGDPDIVNKIFLECAKKIFPVWLERFPEDEKLPELLRTMHAYLYNTTDQREQVTQKQSVDKKVIRNAYKELVSICIPGYENTEKLNRFIDSVDIDPDNPEEAFDAIYDYLDEEDKYFFIFLDYKLEIEDIEWSIKTVLEENFNVSLPLPDIEQYSDCTSLHEIYEIFEDYKTALNAGGYDLIQLDMNADSYVLVVYPLAQQKQVRNSIANTGLTIRNNNCKEKNEINFYHLQINALYHISSLRFQTGLGNDPCFEAARALSALSFSIYSDAGGCNGVLNPEWNTGQDDSDLDKEILSPDYIAFLVATNNMKEARENREYWSWFLDTVVNLVNDPDFATSINTVIKKRKGTTAGILNCIEELKQKIRKDPHHTFHLPERIALYQQMGDPVLVNKIFFECAKKVYPFWQEEFPDDRVLPEILHKINNYLYKGISTDENGEAYNFNQLTEGSDYQWFIESLTSRAGCAADTILSAAFMIYTEAQGILNPVECKIEEDKEEDRSTWLPDYGGVRTCTWLLENPETTELEYWEWLLDTTACLLKEPGQAILALPPVPAEKEYTGEEFRRNQVVTPQIRKKILSVWDQLAKYNYLSDWDECVLQVQTMPWYDISFYLSSDGVVEEDSDTELENMDIGFSFAEIKKEMYQQAPYEGAWLTCTCTFSLKRRILKKIAFDYGDKGLDEFHSAARFLSEEFEKYPRSREYTPYFWQQYIAKSAYLPLPDKLHEITLVESTVRTTEEILAFVEELRYIIREHPSGKLPLAYRLQLYQQIGDTITINRIFFECAKEVYPIWQESYPNDRVLPSILIKIQEFLYPETEEERDVRWFLHGYWSYTEEETGVTRNAGCTTTNLVTGILMESEDILQIENYAGTDDESFDPALWLPDYCAFAAIADDPVQNRNYWNWLLDTVQAVLRNPGVCISDTPPLPQIKPEKEPFKRKQGMFMDTRSKFLIIREAIIADLETKKKAGWHTATLIIDTIERIRMRLTLTKFDSTGKKEILSETPVLYAEDFPNLFSCIEKGLITELKEAMYKEAPYEGAWCQCAFACVLFERNVKNIEFNYDEKEFYGRPVSPTSVRKEFAKYPRSREFTPYWWQACLNINTPYTELPLKVKREKIEEIRRAYSKKEQPSTILALYAIDDKTITLDNGDTLLHVAAEVADRAAIGYLVNPFYKKDWECPDHWIGINPDIQNQMGETALHKLARLSPSSNLSASKIIQSVEVLLAVSANPQIRNERGDTCYHTAAGLGNLTFIKALVEIDATVDLTDKEGRNLLHLIPAEIMRRELDRLRYTKADEDIEKIHRIVEEAYEVCKLLLQSGLDPEKKDSRNKSPFDIAVEYDLKKLAVLYSGEDPDSPEGRLKAAAGGKTIHQAAATGDVEAIEALIDLDIDPNEVYLEYEFKYMSPLAIAAIKGFKACMETLLRKGADPHFRNGESGEGVLKFVIDNTKDKIVYAPNKWITATEIMQVFLDHGVDVNTFVDNESHTILNYTCLKMHWNTRGRQQIRTLLLQTKRCDMNIPDIQGRTALMNFAQSDSQQNPEMDLGAMLEQGASLTAKDKDGNNAVMCAAANKNHLHAYNITSMMLSFGYPPLSEVNNQGQTALDIAVEKGHEDLVKLLLSKL